MNMSFRQNIQKLTRRFYQHDSRFREKLPVVKHANKQVKYALRSRRNVESPASQRTQNYKPGAFEPYPFQITEENKVEVLQRVVSPLHDIPYEEQLASKESYCRNALRSLGHQLYKSGTPIRLNVTKLPCHVNPIVKSPVIHGYLNKADFSIW